MASVAAFSFGALGDFVALLDLAQKVRKSLNASSGGSQDYLTLLVEVDSLVRILRSSTTPSISTRLSHLSPALVQTGCNALKSLHDLLDILERKIMTYQDNLRRGGSARMMMESWRKVGWGLLVRDDEVKKLRWQLSYHIKTFQVVMSYAYCARTNKIGQQSRRPQYRLAKRLPISIGYTWEGGTTVDTAPIQLRDMYDHVVDVPMDLCATPELLDAMLRAYFYGRTGNRFIVKGDYELTTAGSNSLLKLIEPADWTTTMKPGIIVEMSAIIRRKSRSRLRSDVECPCCRRTIPNVRVDVRTVCPHSDCPTTFTISRTNADDPTNPLTSQYIEQADEDITPQEDPKYLLGPLEWRTEHAQELEKVYAESRNLRHVRVLDWLPIMQASTVPRYDDETLLTYRERTGREVPVLWKGFRTLSNGAVIHDVISEEDGSLVSLNPSALSHNITKGLKEIAQIVRVELDPYFE